MNFYQFIQSNLNSGTYGVVHMSVARGRQFPVQTPNDFKELQDRFDGNFIMELFDFDDNLIHTICFDSETAYLVEEDLLFSLS